MHKIPVRAIAIACQAIVGSNLISSPVVLADHPTLGLQQDGAGAITTLTALTLPKGVSVIGFESQTLSNNEIGDIDLVYFAEQDENVHSVASVNNFSLNAAIGLTDNLTVGANLPYVIRSGIREGAHHHDEEPEQSDHDPHDDEPIDADHAAEEALGVSYLGDSRGVGDLTLYGQYRFVGSRDSRLHASALFGIKTPTGRTDVIGNEGDRFEAEHQPGSGSWDLLTGAALTSRWSKVSLDSNVLYSFAGDGSQQSNLGDVFNYNVALSYRLEHEEDHGHGAAHHSHATVLNSWDLAIEINGEWRDYVTVAGTRQTHTGGNLVYVAPSVRFNSSRGWAAYASLGVPVLEDLNGIQSDPKFRLFIGINSVFGNAD